MSFGPLVALEDQGVYRESVVLDGAMGEGGVAAGASEVALYQESRTPFYVSCYAHALLVGLTAVALS